MEKQQSGCWAGKAGEVAAGEGRRESTWEQRRQQRGSSNGVKENQWESRSSGAGVQAAGEAVEAVQKNFFKKAGSCLHALLWSFPKEHTGAPERIGAPFKPDRPPVRKSSRQATYT